MADEMNGERETPPAEKWLRERYGAYRGHPSWRALEEAFQAGRASLAANAATDCARCSGSGEDPEGFYDQSRGDAGHTHDGPCRACNGSGVAANAGSEPVAVLAMRMLVAAGHITQAKADESLRLAAEYTHTSPPEGMAGWKPIAEAPEGEEVLLWSEHKGGPPTFDDWARYKHINQPKFTHFMLARPPLASEAKEPK